MTKRKAKPDVKCTPDQCLLIQWERPHKDVPVDAQGNPVCPRCGAPAHTVLGIMGNPCWAHAPKPKKAKR